MTEDIKKEEKQVDVLSAVKETIATGLKEVKEDLSGQIKEIDERVKSIEALPLKKEAPNINVIPTEYKGRKLSRQGELIKNIACKNPAMFPMLSNEEKADHFSKVMIDIATIAKGSSDLQVGTASEGGYLVPEEYQMELIKLSKDKAFALNECKIIEMSRDSMKIPAELTVASVAWTAEEGTLTDGEGTFTEVDLDNKRLDGLATVSNELLGDSAIDIVSLLTEQFSSAINLELDNQVLNGTGDPVSGLLVQSIGSVVMGGNRFSTVSANDLSEMIYKVESSASQFLDGCKYVINKLGMHYIRTLQDSNGQPIFARPGSNVPGTIWEYPYLVSGKIANTDDGSDYMAVFGNFKKFLIGRRVGVMRIEADPYGLFDSYQTRFRMVTRWAFALADSNAFCKLVSGS